MEKSAAAGPEPATPLGDLLETAAARWPSKTAVDFYDRRFTFSELYDLALRAAAGLQARGVQPGDRVALHLPNTPHYVIGVFGVLLAGAVVVNLSPLAATQGLRRQLIDSGARAVITLRGPTVHGRMAPAARDAGVETVVVGALDDFGDLGLASGSTAPLAQGETAFLDLLENGAEPRRTPHSDLAEEVAVLQYTGGTTGEPKAAMLTHANFCAALSAYKRSGWEFDQPQGSTRTILAVNPLCHIVGLTCTVFQMAATGAEVVMHLRFEPDRALEAIAKKKIAIFSGVPSMYAMLAHHPKVGTSDLRSLRLCFTSGAPMPETVLERFRALAGVVPRNGYGLTETTTAGAHHPEVGDPRAGAVGLPGPYVSVEIVDLEGGEGLAATGQPGEVCISGPQVMKGYWNQPEATEAAIRKGRFHTGDIGYLDADGYLVLIDRKKDMILSGGFNVFPTIVEEAIRQHPAVRDVAVIGVPHAILGQTAKAFVICASGVLQPGELRAFLAERLASYEVPGDIEFRDTLPMTPLGKPWKEKLAQETAAKARRGGRTAGRTMEVGS